ncbi:hypothetical protein N2384_11130 [Bacillus paralicheniformis]|uniref:hypothetical protein n=1 Tax=Bacillus paralicheniformis TaxID=1648923 RepID=UPI0021A44F61|nr:hypothetical protein [Bacillus paralicheniformis]UWS63299.1 hypothetical protein N2384_11130 [Bacillus paralicheniformis]
MTELNAKERVLVALYLEYQKDLPMLENVDANSLGMSQQMFYEAIKKLENEGFLINVKYTKPYGVLLQFAYLSRFGINYVEEKLRIDEHLSKPEKLKEIARKLAKGGYNEIKDIAIKLAAELLKS